MAVQAIQTARHGPGFLLGTVIGCKWEIVSDWSRWPKEGSGGLWIRCVQEWFVRYPSIFSFGEVASRLKSFSCSHKIFNKLNFRRKISSLFRESLVIMFIILSPFESHQFYGLYCIVLTLDPEPPLSSLKKSIWRNSCPSWFVCSAISVNIPRHLPYSFIFG